MPQGMASDIRVRSALKHDGTVEIGRYRMLQGGTSVGGVVPMEHARALGLLDAKETDVFVNYELGVVMHKIPEDTDGDG